MQSATRYPETVIVCSTAGDEGAICFHESFARSVRGTLVWRRRSPIESEDRHLSGAGISMNALWSVHRELAEGSLVRVLPDYKADDQTALWLVYPKSNVLTVKVRIFIDFLLERFGDVPAWSEAG